MSEALGILSYAGPAPVARRSFFAACRRVLVTVLLFAIVLVVIAVRGALLLGGYACVLAGTILLTLGGRRSAQRKLADWRGCAGELLRLWLDDMIRPLRRWRAQRRAGAGAIAGGGSIGGAGGVGGAGDAVQRALPVGSTVAVAP